MQSRRKTDCYLIRASGAYHINWSTQNVFFNTEEESQLQISRKGTSGRKRKEMNVQDIVVRNGVYTTNAPNAERKVVSNCTLRLKTAVKAGERSGYIGTATDKNGVSK